MVLDAPPQHHQQQQQIPVVRDFLGLGNLVSNNDRGEGDSVTNGVFRSAAALPHPSINMDYSTGLSYPVFNLSSAIENSFSIPKSPDERFLEGSAETFGFSCPKQWSGMTGSNAAGSDANAQPSPTQLTIFYGGIVNVYNNIPVNRAEEIMQLAAKSDSLSSSPQTPPVSYTPGFCQPTTMAETVHGTGQMIVPIVFAADQASHNQLVECAITNFPSTTTSPQPMVPKALPLARKASLARFLEKRKERMQMMSPYFKKQLVPLAHGEQQMMGIQQNPAFSDLQSQYFTRPSFLFCMQEQMDMSYNATATRE